jgi:hypothetical protein
MRFAFDDDHGALNDGRNDDAHANLEGDLEDDAADLDAEFPLGDGVADVDAEVACPYCGEVVTVALDPGGGEVQDYVEDCAVCCRPWRVTVHYDGGGAHVALAPLDED